MTEKKQSENTARVVEIVEVNPNNLAQLREWTELKCRGWTVADLASSLGVDATISAIADRLGRNLSEDAQRVVYEACEKELREGKK